MITEDYVSFEVAKLLKEKGFVVPYDSFRGVYINGEFFRRNPGQAYLHNTGDEIIEACSLQLAMKWLREVHKLFIEIGVSIDLLGNPHFNYSIVNKDGKYFREGYTSFEWEYEKASEAAIKYCLEKLV